MIRSDTGPMVVQGRELREADVAQIRALIERHPERTRRRLALAKRTWRRPNANRLIVGG